MLELYENIKKERIKKGLTQQQLADLTGYERSMISRIEKGEIDLQQSKIELIAKALNVPTPELVGYHLINNGVQNTATIHNINNSTANINSNNTTHVYREMSDTAQELLRIYEHLDVRRQTKLLNYAYDLETDFKKNPND